MTANRPIYPSRLFREAAGIPVSRKRAPHTAAHEDRCVMCAAPISAGEPCLAVTKNTFDSAFNNRMDLRNPRGKYICGDCAELWQQAFLQKYSKAVATRHGVYKLASNEDHAWFVLTPPEPPFVAIQSTTTQQHLIWRAPVTYSKDLVHVRFGDEVLTLRPQRIREALSALSVLEALMKAEGLKGLPCKFDRYLANPRVGHVRPDVIRLAKDKGCYEQVEVLHALSMGEW